MTGHYGTKRNNSQPIKNTTCPDEHNKFCGEKYWRDKKKRSQNSIEINHSGNACEYEFLVFLRKKS